jgi:hypothetical protein
MVLTVAVGIPLATGARALENIQTEVPAKFFDEVAEGSKGQAG